MYRFGYWQVCRGLPDVTQLNCLDGGMSEVDRYCTRTREIMRTLLISIVVCLLLFLNSCARTQEDPGSVTPSADEIQVILDVITKLEEAANEADPAKAESVLLLEDARFSEIEDFIPEPFGADTVRRIHNWIRTNSRPGDNVRFTDIKVYFLASDVAYATAIQELNFDTPGKSRVTFLFLKQNNEWGIIHAHYSTMPSE
jgi:hypothetical protein